LRGERWRGHGCAAVKKGGGVTSGKALSPEPEWEKGEGVGTQIDRGKEWCTRWRGEKGPTFTAKGGACVFFAGASLKKTASFSNPSKRGDPPPGKGWRFSLWGGKGTFSFPLNRDLWIETLFLRVNSLYLYKKGPFLQTRAGGTGVAPRLRRKNPRGGSLATA